MATTAPFVKLLRQLSRGKDEYRSGAVDITWDDGKASIFLVFGQPNHATFEGLEMQPLEGQAALSALVTRLPGEFTISPWRKVVVRTETLKCTLDELMEPLAQLAGATSPSEGSADQVNGGTGDEVGTGFQADLDFGLEDFPLLPLGESLWSDAAASVVHLDVLVPKLPDALIVLTGPKLRAAAVVVGGQIIDAVWVDDQEQAVGEGAAMALMGAREGSISGYRLDQSKLAEALTMLWRCPVAFRRMHTSWLNAGGLLDDLEQERQDCALLLSGPHRGVALYLAGQLVAMYTEAERQPVASRDALQALLATPGGWLTIRRRADARSSEGLPEASFHAFVGASPASAPIPAPADAAESEQGPPPAAESDTSTEAGPPDTDMHHSGQSLETAAGTGGVAAVEPPPPLPAGTDESVASGSSEPPSPPDSDPRPRAVSSNGRGPEAAGEPDWAWPPLPPQAADSEAPPGARPDGALAAWGETFHPGPAPAALAPSSEDDIDDAAAGDSSASWPSAQIQPEWSFPTAEPAPPEAEAGGEAGAELGATEAGYEPSRLGIDYDTVKNDLIQIGILWLGGDDVAPVAEVIRNTTPSVDDFIATIDAIKAMALPGHDPSVLRAMAREMHYHAAEYLCGA